MSCHLLIVFCNSNSDLPDKGKRHGVFRWNHLLIQIIGLDELQSISMDASRGRISWHGSGSVRSAACVGVPGLPPMSALVCCCFYFAFCKRCGELLDSGGARPAGFPYRKGNAFGSGRSAEAMCRSDSEHFAASTLRIVKPPFFVFEQNKAILQMRDAVPVFVPMTVLSFEGPFNGSHSHVGSRQRASYLRLLHACVERLDVQ